MTTSESHSSEIPASAGRGEAATAQAALIERKRQLVKDIFAGKPSAEYIPADQVPDTTLIKKGEVVDSAQHQRIQDAEQAVLDALETIPKPDPAQFKDLLPG